MLHTTPPEGYVRRALSYGPYSPSRLITAKCPSRFFGQYIRKDQITSFTLAAARGNAIHEVLSKITEYKMVGRDFSSRQIQEWVSEAIGKYPAAYEQIDLVMKAAEAYVANPSPYINSNTTCEKAFAVELWEEQTFFDEAVPGKAWVSVPYDLHDAEGKRTTNPSVFFGGRIDQMNVDEQLKIVTVLDHKSTPSANENSDHMFQVGAYAWLVSLFYPGYTIKTVIHFCHPMLNFYQVPVTWYPEDLAGMESEIVGMISAIERMENFPAIPSNGCDYCHKTAECEILAKVQLQKSKGTVDTNVRVFEDLLRIAKEVTVLDAASKALTTALKAGINTLCPQNGVDIGGLWYGYKASEESVDWEATDKKIREESERAKIKISEGSCESEADRERCEELSKVSNLDSVLTRYGVDPNLFKNYSATKMKNLWRLDKPELHAFLGPLVMKDKSTRFGAHKR